MGYTTVFHVETPWTRIISDELWNAVQKRPIDTTNMNREAKRYLLSAKVVCEQCNRTMAIRRRTGRFKCVCKHEDMRFDCRDLPLNPIVIESLVVSGLLECIGSPEDEEGFAGSLRRAIAERNLDYERQRTQLLESIGDIDKELDRMLQDLTQLSSEAARERFNRRFDERNDELESCRARYHEIQHLTADTEELDKLSIALTSDWIRQNELIQPSRGFEEIFEMMCKVIHTVRVYERPGLRHDVAVTYLWSLPGQDEPIELTRLFEDQLIADDESRKQEELRDLKKRIQTGEFEISKADIGAIERDCAEFMRKFKRFPAVAASLFLAAIRNPDMLMVTVAHCFGCNKVHQLDDLRGYSRHAEWTRFVAILCDPCTSTDDEKVVVKVRKGTTPSMRAKLTMVDSPILRLGIVDPANGDRDVTNEEWVALMAEVGNERGTAFRGWTKTSDRKGLNTYFHIIRNDLRCNEIPAGMLTHSRVNRLLRHLDDEGIGMDLLRVLLRIQGETDMPSPNAAFKLSSPVKKWGKGPRQSQPIIPGIIKKGRKPLLAKRRAARAAHSANDVSPG
jgi:hypothetical protein